MLLHVLRSPSVGHQEIWRERLHTCFPLTGGKTLLGVVYGYYYHGYEPIRLLYFRYPFYKYIYIRAELLIEILSKL